MLIASPLVALGYLLVLSNDRFCWRKDKGDYRYALFNPADSPRCERGCVLVRYVDLPLYEYASLDGVDDAAEARLLFVASQHQAHLAGEGGGQPVPHLWRHRLGLDVAELILCVHQTPKGWGRSAGLTKKKKREGQQMKSRERREKFIKLFLTDLLRIQLKS